MGVLLMLMTIGGLITAVMIFAVSMFTGKAWLTRFTLGAVALWFLFYAAMLFGFSFFSTEKTLAVNQPKEYCGFYLDCHLHTMVTGVRTATQIGDEKAQRLFYIVKVKVSSDARNPNIAFRLITPKAEVIDEGERIYTRIAAAEAQLPTANIRLDQDIKGDETIEKEIVFDITEPTDKLKLLITEGYGIDKVIEAVLVDDEDSIFHKHNYFEITALNQTADL